MAKICTAGSLNCDDVNEIKAWLADCKIRREDANGVKEWWFNGKRHRDDGEPAVIHPDGTKEWWVNGVLQKVFSPVTNEGVISESVIIESDFK